MADTQALLDDIKKLQAAADVAGLEALEAHADKKVRKAARKAIHVLRSKGIKAPAKARSWTEASIQSMRRHLGPIAMIDMATSPGVTRLTLSIPHDEEGAALFVALLEPHDRLLDFRAFQQTDGQQTRMGRDWGRDSGARSLPAAWAAARMLWARDQTHRSNAPLPPDFDANLPMLVDNLGPAPDSRPEPTFLDEALAEVEPSTTGLSEIFASANMTAWPLLFEANAFFEALNDRMEGLTPESLGDDDRLSHIRAAALGDEGLRAGLRGPLANALDDVAIIHWLDSSLADAKRVRELVRALRQAEAPETVEGVAELVQMQVTAVAMQQLRQQAGIGGHAHHHHHDHDHDHDHHHDHDHDHHDHG